MTRLKFGIVLLLLLLTACATTELTDRFSIEKMLPLSELKQWSFEGRLSVVGQPVIFVSWHHAVDHEQLKLSGPLGQGATTIDLTPNKIMIDKGTGEVLISDQVEAFLFEKTGVPIPVQSLRYWVMGLPLPSQAYQMTDNGFVQTGWLVEYKQLQAVGAAYMPAKIFASNAQNKIKLIIDQWDVGNAK